MREHGHIRGPLIVLLSAFAFYMATWELRRADEQYGVPAEVTVFFRFILGYLILQFYLFHNKVEVGNRFWLWQRAIWNSVAVFLFMMSVAMAGVSRANFFNMTYPGFVALLAPSLLSEKVSFGHILGVVFALVGAALVGVRTGFVPEFTTGDILGLLSGLTAAVAIVALRRVRQSASTSMILFYTFRSGTFFTLPFFIWKVQFSQPWLENFSAWSAVVQSALWGVGGQLAITYGFRYVTAVTGSILSSARILIALVAGVWLLDEKIGMVSAIGALLIFAANVIVARTEGRQLKKKET